MESLNLLIWLTVSFSLCFLLCDSYLLKGWRTRIKAKSLQKLIGCYFCTGTWTGLLVAILVSTIFPEDFWPFFNKGQYIGRLIEFSLVSSFWCYLLDRVLLLIENNYKQGVEND